MDAVRLTIKKCKAAGWQDDAILAHISNRPTQPQLAELRAATSATDQSRPAKAMANAVQSEIDAINKGEA